MKVLAAAAPLPQRSFFTHRIVDPIPAPIRQTDFGAEDPPRHVGNEGFLIFSERVRLKIMLIDFFWLVWIGRFRRPCRRGASWGCWSWEIKSGVALCKGIIR